MSRTITSTMIDALEVENGYKPILRFDAYRSQITFEALTRDYAVTGADTNPAADNAMRQEIIYNATAGLVTFYSDGNLKYALDGDATPVTTTTASSVKPGLYGNKIYVQVGTDVLRRTINWSSVISKSTDPFSADATLSPTDTILAVHGISETECIVLGDGDGGISIAYFTNTSEVLSPVRFMFPVMVDWEGSSGWSMQMLALYSTAIKLGNKIYVYASSPATGVVHGVFYDLDTETWSSVFTALPTDLEVSLCTFRIANSFVRNNVGYIVGQFYRTDIYETNKPYTLILSTRDGERFSMDRFTYVTALGYRFLGTVGSDNKLYLANSNRVCEALSTWVFDGDTDTTSPSTAYSMDEIITVQGGEGTVTIELAAGDETVYDDTNLVVGSRIKLYYGLNTAIGNEFILYSTYIVSNVKTTFSDGERNYIMVLVQEAQWKLTGLSMPFYAEFFGLSSIYDPMTEQSGKLYAAPATALSETQFFVDFWNHEGYEDISASITPMTTITDGGVGPKTADGSHKLGMITKEEIKTILGISKNPKITGSSITAKLYGWSRPATTGVNDYVNVIIETCDEDGNDIQTVITTDTKTWSITWPTYTEGDEPIEHTVSGAAIADGRYIRRIGLVFEAANTTVFAPARVEITSNIEVGIKLEYGNTPWENQGDGTFKIPAPGQPFIMFAQRPYNAFNFDIAASFENTVTGGIQGYPVACGLVGLAEDGANFILGRYDKVWGYGYIVAVKNGIETILAGAAPGWSPGTLHELEFSHRDGTFTLSMLNEGTGVKEPIVTYDWTASDGFMFGSTSSTKKCGIWGGIMVPTVQISGYAGLSKDTSSNVDGIPVLPLHDIDDFPNEGSLSISGNVYSYDAKVNPLAYTPGPYQARQNGTYQPPFGIGKAGIHCAYFNWLGGSNTYAGKLIGLDNGCSFISAGTTWQVFITTGGQRIYLKNRSQHYSDNSQIGKISISLANRVFPALPGFTGISLTSGEAMRHPYRSRAALKLDGDIYCYWFMGTGGERDTTVRELIQTATAFCGTQATFPGDFYDPSLSVNGETAIFQDNYSEGFDLEYYLSAPTTHEIRTNVKLDSTNYDNGDDFDTDTGLKLVLTNLGSGDYRAALISTPSATVIYQKDYTSGTSGQHFRVLFYENSITVYHNHQWILSVACDNLIYTQTSYVDVKAYTASSVSFQNVYVRDLSDGRDAIYIDLETDGSSALNSIIQERPVEIGANPDGTIFFFSDESNRDAVTLLADPYSHTLDNNYPREAASDAIVYASTDVISIIKELFARTFGFSTKIIRVPNLGVGAIEAGIRQMKIAYESKDKHILDIRPDARVMPGDLLTFSYTLSGTGKQQASTQVVVETVDFTLNGKGKKITSNMRITARGYLDE